MAETILTELVKFAAEKLGSKVCKAVAEATDIDSQMKALQDIKATLEATLLDAADSDSSKQQLCTRSQQDVLEKLERGLARLIVFQDAKAAKAKQKELMGGSKFTKEENQGYHGRNHAQFGTLVSLSAFNQTRTLSNVSGSYMSTDMVVGRDGDREKMVGLLLDSSSAAGTLPVASIVGMGGVGKTTLAQYVYNDDRIKRYFDVQFWVFATQDFNVKDTLRQMVTCATDEKALDYEIDQLQRRLFQVIAGRKFLLVLDGVWDGDNLRANWMDLRALLKLGAQGSKVLLTTRSKTVAGVIGTQDPHMVSDLRDDDSLLLFRHMAITECHEPGVEVILKEIAKMCPKVPLVIRAIGSLLAARPSVQEWQAFRNDQLAHFASYGRDIISTLKLSYDQLSPNLKLCATYCSLFPKGHNLEKRFLIHLWIAMGYVEAEYSNQNLEEVAEGYVLCLLNRGFFFWDNRNHDHFRMHDLMHDLVISIAGLKYKMTTSDTIEFDESVRHLSFYLSFNRPWKAPPSLFKIKNLESLLLPLGNHGGRSFLEVSVFLSNKVFISRGQCLRILRISGLRIDKLSKSLGKLIHLRYLDISENYDLRKLPDSITKLVNLYFLNLSKCRNLKELPEDIGNLGFLRHLHLSGCDKLSHIPKGLGRLTNLETLGYFIVGKPSNTLKLCVSKAKSACGLGDLCLLNHLKGELKLVLADRAEDIVSEAKAANLDRKGITEFTMIFEDSIIEDEMVLENLKPSTDLEYLQIGKYGGKRLPSWMRERIDMWLPNLVRVKISECTECIFMCSFGRLPHLRELELENAGKVEYIEDCSNNNDNQNMVVVVPDEHTVTPLFPSLTHLVLRDMPRLKGWCSGSVVDSAHDQIQGLNNKPSAFPKLVEIEIDMMELLITLAKVFLPTISSLQYLRVYGKSKVVTRQTTRGPSSSNVILLKNYFPMLRHLSFTDIFNDDSQMRVLPEEFRGMSSLESLAIHESEALEGVPEWIDTLTSLKTLIIDECASLKSLPHEISNLSNLMSLRLYGCSWEFAERCQAPSGEDWPKIQHIPTIIIEPYNDDY